MNLFYIAKPGPPINLPLYHDFHILAQSFKFPCVTLVSNMSSPILLQVKTVQRCHVFLVADVTRIFIQIISSNYISGEDYSVYPLSKLSVTVLRCFKLSKVLSCWLCFHLWDSAVPERCKVSTSSQKLEFLSYISSVGNSCNWATPTLFWMVGPRLPYT